MLRLSVGSLSCVIAICSVAMTMNSTPVEGNAEAKHSDLEKRVARLEHTVQRILEYMDKDQHSRAANWESERNELGKRKRSTGPAEPKKSSGTEEKKEMAFLLWTLTSGLQDTRNRLNKLTNQTETLINNTALLDTANSRNLKSIAVVMDLLNTTANISDCKKVEEEMAEIDSYMLCTSPLITLKEFSKRKLEIKEKSIPLWRKAVFMCDFNVNLPFPQCQTTMLQIAAILDDVQLARLLLWRGADIQARDYFNQTVIHYSAMYNSTNVVKLLLDHGVDIEQTNGYSQTALLVATEGVAIEAARILIQHGANVNAVDLNTGSSLQTASYLKSIPLIKLLLDAKANIDYQDKNGRSALHYAVRRNCLECVEMLVQRGANVNLRDKDGVAAYH